MDGSPIQTTSFIPKKPLVSRGGLSANISGILWFFSIVILIFSVAGYFIELRLETVNKEELAQLKKNLKKARDKFDLEEIKNMTRFDAKLTIADDLLYLRKDPRYPDTMAHITLQPLFELLTAKTLKSVRFKDFKYSNVDNQKIEIRMSGEAKSIGSIANYSTVAEQARKFSETRQLSNVIVSDLNLGANNNVVFNLSASIDPEFISYTKYLESKP